MLLDLQRAVTTLVMPLGLAATLLAVAMILRVLGRRRGEFGCIGLALGILWLASSPRVAIGLLGALEATYPPLEMTAVPTADVIIVLGGTLEPASAPRVVPHLSEGANRIAYASRLFAAGKAPQILVSGGGSTSSIDGASEAELMADVLEWFGVPRTAIVLEQNSRNTQENAEQSAGVWRQHGWHTALLVTSASHMPRAVFEFACAGVPITPASADVQVSQHARTYPMQWFPNAVMLWWTSLAMKEYLGLAATKLRACGSRDMAIDVPLPDLQRSANGRRAFR